MTGVGQDSWFWLSKYCFRMYGEAISYYEKALALSTRSVSTYAGLAYTYHLQVYKLLFFSYYVFSGITWCIVVFSEKQM